MPNKTRKSFWKHPMELLDDEAQVESCFGPFGDSVSVGARYVHGLHHTIGSEIVLDVADGTPR